MTEQAARWWPPGCPRAHFADSRTAPSFEQALIAEHEQAISEIDAFGVPTIRIPGSKLVFFGPVVDPVPTGAEALDLWQYVQWSLDKPYLYEVKRERRHKAASLGLAQVNETLEPVGAGRARFACNPAAHQPAERFGGFPHELGECVMRLWRAPP